MYAADGIASGREQVVGRGRRGTTRWAVGVLKRPVTCQTPSEGRADLPPRPNLL